MMMQALSAQHAPHPAWRKPDGLEALMKAMVRQKAVKPRSEILSQGNVPTTAHVLLSGHGYRYKMMKDGRRQITAVLMPGDICDLEAVMCGRADYAVAALTPCVVGEIPKERFTNAATLEPNAIQELWRRLLRDEAISREWLVSAGCRTALEKVAHLLCELRVRLTAAGLAQGEHIRIPFTQVELGDVLGLSSVHINRMLQDLRRMKLIALSGTTLTVLDAAALERVAKFDPAYLQAT